MTLTITAEQRDAIYDQILNRLSAIEDIWIAVQEEDYPTADRLAQEYSDDLRLLDDLGWGNGSGGAVGLRTPPDVLRRVFSRLRDLATSHAAGQAEEWADARAMQERDRLVVEVCQQVLADLEESSS